MESLKSVGSGLEETEKIRGGKGGGSDSEESLDSRDGLQGILEQDFMPEVTWLEFRYFSGSSWSDSWDSSGGRGLPVAVEIRFEVEEIEPVEEVEVAEDGLPIIEDETLPLEEELDLESSEDTLSLSDDTLMSEPLTEETPYHRCIVVLGLAQRPNAISNMDLMGDVLP